MHLGVVKVGLLWLARLEVISQRIIFTTKKNSMKDRTLTTPNIKLILCNSAGFTVGYNMVNDWYKIIRCSFRVLSHPIWKCHSNFLGISLHPWWCVSNNLLKCRKFFYYDFSIDLSIADFHVYLLKVEFKVIHYSYCSIPF